MDGQLYIGTLFAFIATDADGSEGITAFEGPDGVMYPMVGADMERVDDLKPIAQAIAKASDTPIHLVRFSKREVLETFNEIVD